MIRLLALLVSAPALAAPTIAVYDVTGAGGEGARLAGLDDGLREMGFTVDPITDLQPLTLATYDIVYLSDMHRPGNVHEAWRASITAYVEAGGSVLQTWHHHILGEVGQGVRRVYGSRAMKVVADHPAVAGIPNFESRFDDHIVESVGPRGTVLIENEFGDPVAVAGTLGKGKVISTGLTLAIRGANASVAPRGEERELLQAFLTWLTPEVPAAERLAALIERPQLALSPAVQQVAAGFPATFTLAVAAQDPARVAATTGDGQLTPRTTDGPVRRYMLTVPTQRGDDGRRPVTVTVEADGRTLTARAEVAPIAAAVPADETRGVWLHVAAEKHPSIVMPELKRLGLNLAVLRIAGGTAAWYASRVQPDVQDPLAAEGGDWMAETVKHAHANQIAIHPYLNNVVVEGRTSPETLARLRAAGRLMEGPDGEPIDWYCPSQEINLAAIEAPMLELARNYDIDGIQYDFIRYPNSRGCFCARCRAGFEAETAQPVADWPRDVLPDGPRHEAWVRYRADRISGIVRRVSTNLKALKPDLVISGAVFASWPASIEEQGQDWVRWAREGWLDVVCPMNYTLDLQAFEANLARYRAALPPEFPIWTGIGINSGAGRMSSPSQLAVHIALARRQGCPGWVGFAYQPNQTASLFEPLSDWLH